MITIYPEKFSLLLMSMVPVRTLFPPFKVLDNHTIKSIARSSLCPCNVDHHFLGMTRKTHNVIYGIKNWQASFILDCISYHSLKSDDTCFICFFPGQFGLDHTLTTGVIRY